MSQVKKGALISYLNIGLTNVIGLILTPFIIRSLGDSEYGLYILIGSVISYISLLDLGLNNAIIRYVAKYRVENNKEKEENFLSVTAIIYGVISLVILGIGAGIYFKIDKIFEGSLTAEELIVAKKMFLVLIFNLTITLPGGMFTAICNAYEHFLFPRVLLTLKYLSRAILIFVLLFYFPYAMTLVWIDTILNVIIIGISCYYVFKSLKVRFKLYQWNTKLVRDVFSYSIWVFVIAMVARLQWQTGQIVLGISVNTVTVAIYGVGVMLGSYYGAFASAVNSLLLPKATKMTVTDNSVKSYNIEMQRIGRVNGFILFLILSGFVVYGKEFIILWVGKEYLPAWEIACLIMVAMTLPLMQWFGNSILEAKRKNRFRSVISLITVVIAIVIALFLVPIYQLRGVIYPLFVAMLINGFVMMWYFNRIFGFSLVEFMKKAVMKLFLVVIVLLSVFLLVKRYWNIETWLDLALHVVVYFSVYSCVLYLVLMNSQEKKIVTRVLRK